MKIEVSFGEVLDKISILAIKKENITDLFKLANVTREKDLLEAAVADLNNGSTFDTLYLELKRINQELWQIEDAIREKERQKQFDDEFIQLARSVYFTNDKRSKLKHIINKLANSEIIEEKYYTEY